MKIKDVCSWLRANGHYTAGLTGQDARALEALAHCWELYAVSDSAARPNVLIGASTLVASIQSKFWMLGRELIAMAMDWSDRDKLWPDVERLALGWPMTWANMRAVPWDSDRSSKMESISAASTPKLSDDATISGPSPMESAARAAAITAAVSTAEDDSASSAQIETDVDGNPFTSEQRKAFRLVRTLTPEQREQVLGWFCDDCRRFVKRGDWCHCENDD